MQTGNPIPKFNLFSMFFSGVSILYNFYSFFNYLIIEKKGILKKSTKKTEFRNWISILDANWESSSDNTNFYYVFSGISILYNFYSFFFFNLIFIAKRISPKNLHFRNWISILDA